jgi:branched-chain amino acid transport system ATP-binding protein
MPPEALLELAEVAAGYGDAIVLEDVSLAVPAGGSLAVLGRNGVGKTTLVATIMGCTRLRRGSVRWRGREIGRLPPFRRARAGLGWVPQERAVFPSLTVEENLAVVARPGRWDLAAVYRLFPRLGERRRNLGHELSGGEQQMLAIGRALMTNPRLLLLDEPLEGLAPVIVDELSDALRRMIDETDMAMLLIEQHADIALQLTDSAIVLERGRIVHRTASRGLLADAAALDRLLGLGAGTAAFSAVQTAAT